MKNKLSNKMPFIFLEHCSLTVKDSNIVAKSKKDDINIPIESIATIMLGPGTSISHEAVKILSKNNTQINFVSSDNLLMYSCAKSFNRKNTNYIKQLKAKIDDSMEVVNRLVSVRYPDASFEKISSVDNFLLKEAVLVKNKYKELASEHGVPWTKRKQRNPDDLINKTLNIHNNLLYNICKSVISHLGYSSQIGFLHSGHSNSFVFDLSDCYKEKYSFIESFKNYENYLNLSENELFKCIRKNINKKYNKDKIFNIIIKDLNWIFNHE